jgi:uncharacterized membrane protein
MVESSDDRGRGRRDVERLMFFSDAVFAIALTILAIDLRLPDPSRIVDGATLLDSLADVAPGVCAFGLSFFVIVMFWWGNFQTFRVMTRVSGLTAIANLVLLFFVVLLPFPTSILGAVGPVPAVVAFYGLCAGLAGTSATMVWVIAAEIRHDVDGLSPEFIRRKTKRAAVAPVLLLGGIPLALISAPLTLAAWFLIAPIQLLVERWLNRPQEPPTS